MCIRKWGVLLLLLILSGCADAGALSPEPAAEDALSVSALFQAENGEALQDGAAQFSAGDSGGVHPLDSSGVVSVSGLPRSGELLLTLFDRRQEVRGTMTLSFTQGAVIDAMTGEDGVGHVTVRDDTREVGLLFRLTEDGALQCTLWLARTVPSGPDLPRKGV